MAFMNSMFHMSQFVVVVTVPDESSATLASHFIQHLLMKFGLCYIVVFVDGTPSKWDFIAMYEALQ